jgi:hypothetical protein
MLIISIVPRLPPAIDGVGDYAFKLAYKMREQCGIDTVFISGAPSCNGIFSNEGFLICPVASCSVNSLLDLLNQHKDTVSIVLLHYVGYGYAKRGCPHWLVKGVTQWRYGNPNLRLITMFHELYHPIESPLKSGTWLSLIQKNLAMRVAQVSDRCLTSRESFAQKLACFGQGKHEQIPILPVFSTVGEPNDLLPLASRQKRLVIFGQHSSKKRAYQKSMPIIKHACERLNIREIWDIGPSTDLHLEAINGVPIIEKGKQSDAEISTILSNSVAGFFNYSAAHLPKSTIFAAYCAHGMLPIGHCTDLNLSNEIKSGKHYWFPQPQQVTSNLLEKLQPIASNAHAWYQTHNLSAQAKTFANYIVSANT